LISAGLGNPSGKSLGRDLSGRNLFLLEAIALCKSVSNPDELFATMRAILLTIPLHPASNKQKGKRSSRQNPFGSLHKVVLRFPTDFSPTSKEFYLAC
jgi:hypothetical protein